MRAQSLLLLAKDPELIHVLDSSEGTPLHCAIKASIAKQLLDHKPGLIDMVDSCGRTALHTAIMCKSSIEMLDFLLERRPGLSNAVDAGHQNALHLAAYYGHRDLFQAAGSEPSIDRCGNLAKQEHSPYCS